MSSSEEYVVLLLDGNTTQFKDDLVQGRGRGGIIAANGLSNAISEYLRSGNADPKGIRILVQIFSDFKRNLGGDSTTKMSYLAAFAANFNSASSFFTFADVVGKHAVQVRTTDHFTMYAADPNCICLIFGVSTNPAYIDMLASYQGLEGKLVLFRAGPIHPRYEQLGLQIIEFKDVFGSRTVPEKAPGPVICPDRNGALRRFAPGGQTYTSSGGKICWDFQKGYCSRLNCKFDHPIVDVNNPYNLPTSGPQGLIPVNESGERIDFFITPPTNQQWQLFRENNPCFTFHNHGQCEQGDNCNMNHGRFNHDVLYCLQLMKKGVLCQEGGQCRRLNCQHGHHCQDDKCASGKAGRCTMPQHMHGMDTKIAEWVVPVDNESSERDDSQFTGEGAAATIDPGSAWSSPKIGTKIGKLIDID